MKQLQHGPVETSKYLCIYRQVSFQASAASLIWLDHNAVKLLSCKINDILTRCSQHSIAKDSGLMI